MCEEIVIVDPSTCAVLEKMQAMKKFGINVIYIAHGIHCALLKDIT